MHELEQSVTAEEGGEFTETHSKENYKIQKIKLHFYATC